MEEIATAAPSPSSALSPRMATAESIRELRLAGRLEEASAACEQAQRNFPDDHFFPKILADLYFQQGKFEAAFVALADYLGGIPPNKKSIGEFANRYYRFRRVLSKDELSKLAELLDSILDQAHLNKNIINAVRAIIKPDVSSDRLPQADTADEREFINLLSSDANFIALVKLERRIEEKAIDRVEWILDAYVLDRERTQATFRIDLFCVSIYEKLHKFAKAMKVVSELLKLRLDSVAIRSLFRICRLLKKYDAVDNLLTQEPSIIKGNDFNILYELVYYFEAKNDLEHLQKVLRTIDKSFAQNLPVLKTLRNFYIRFGMLEDARRLEPVILQLLRGSGETPSRFVNALAESETELASKVQELYSQLEHQKQLAAISDLTTGISHELGQPITNIRYTIQFYRKLLQKNVTLEGVSKVFDSILEETDRMGGLIKRLSPLTSSKTVVEKFDVMDRIRIRVNLEEPRLYENKISVSIHPDRKVIMEGDPVKFDQLISNLLLNSIDAIGEVKQPKRHYIKISVEATNREIQIAFSDTGVGIPIKNKNKIFDPFFSTKAPGKGEGLGLFIVWNLLKMQGGRISVDSHYQDGARFVITIPKDVSDTKEENI